MAVELKHGVSLARERIQGEFTYLRCIGLSSKLAELLTENFLLIGGDVLVTEKHNATTRHYIR